MQKKYFGNETEKAIRNFPFSGTRVPEEFLRAVVEIKLAAVRACGMTGSLEKAKQRSIEQACRFLLEDLPVDQFPLPAFQGGAGTSINMNVNEVVASRASELLGRTVHPNDDVNCLQSTNDIIPSALRITALRLSQNVLDASEAAEKSLRQLAKKLHRAVKVGRTHLQDAVPTTLGAEFGAHAEALARNISWLRRTSVLLLDLNMGGNAIGNSINAPRGYITALYRELKKVTGLPVRPAKNLMTATSSHTDLCRLMQALSCLALDLSRLAGDLRLLSSGPAAGLGEIRLPALQNGSSIMPGKVNPVLPEAVNQLYYFISGNTAIVEHAVAASQLELNVMMPVTVPIIIESLMLSAEVVRQFDSACLQGIMADERRCRQLLEASTAYATLLVPKLGYDRVKELVRESVQNGVSIRTLAVEKKFISQRDFDKLVKSFIKHI